ncbi:hypothetical protein DKP78_14880 [Enterococcus faecium]|nr:hypothetical protein DKP78_14880 [Enterococcus faecium]
MQKNKNAHRKHISKNVILKKKYSSLNEFVKWNRQMKRESEIKVIRWKHFAYFMMVSRKEFSSGIPDALYGKCENGEHWIETEELLP